MRRGHPGMGGWRNENHRHFRPRTGVSPRFRPPRAYPLLDDPRFPPPSPHLHRGPPRYNTHLIHSEDHGLPDYQERNQYRNLNHHPILPDRNHQQRPRHPYPYTHSNLNQDDNNQYKHSLNYYKDSSKEPYHINSLGDIDQRQLGNVYQTHRTNTWVNPSLDQRHFYEDRNVHKYPKPEPERQVEGNKVASVDYTGHRPPSSDYYGSTSSTIINNNNTSFSRSVDDTVDIVRKRLMNRNDSQSTTEDALANQNIPDQEIGENLHQNTQQEQPVRKRIQKQKQNVKSNCDKMKTNIVHQLFKMDKDKIHKLMDDPGSSSKFEYAISSLITESQNSLNRQMRSAAEKSLVSSSSDFIHNNTNTIYEDTFMKQMQCILDPQDTVFLEDIKPLVMAELSKVLQLDDIDLRYDTEYQNTHYNVDEQHNAIYDIYNYEDYPQEKLYDEDLRFLPNYEDSTINDIDGIGLVQTSENTQNEQECKESVTIFERRSSVKSNLTYDQDRRHSSDSQRQRRNTDNPIEEKFCSGDDGRPLFDTNPEQVSEDEDTFAELDRQYHVPVDHNFLDDVSARTTPTYTQSTDQIYPNNCKSDIDNQSPLLTMLPVTMQSLKSKEVHESQITAAHIKQEILQSPDFPKENSTPTNTENVAHKIEHIDIKTEHVPDCKEMEKEISRCDVLTKSKTSQSNSRKRSIDQRPSHRKEKRKKSESSSTDAIKSLSHKHEKSKNKCFDGPKTHSVCTSTVSSKKISKNSSKNNETEKSYSDKYVKRKESQKSNNRETHKRRKSSSSSQTALSPKDNNNSSIVTQKSDSKVKYKTIDMFLEQPKKVTVHHAHRNTAPTSIPKATEDNKVKQTIMSPCKEIQMKHATTQVFKRVISKETQTFESKCSSSRYCQTEILKYSKGIQTPQAFLHKPKPKAKDAFERMKEIDMEIQTLLQEKFKLYHNLESRDSCSIGENLGMTVLNVTPIDDNERNSGNEEVILIDSSTNEEVDVDTDDDRQEDSIVDDFTNIPVEELEEIALETAMDRNIEVPKTVKRKGRNKSLQTRRLHSSSPSSTSSRRSNKKEKAPIISLIEQIITDDRPLEDIISLDDLEEPPKKKQRPKSKPKRKRSKKDLLKNLKQNPYKLKPCSVVLIKKDITKYLKSQSQDIKEIKFEDKMESIESAETKNQPIILSNETLEENEVPLGINFTHQSKSTEPRDQPLVEETVDNDLQFDMLDVSEDIVIGESCEIKDKDSSEHVVNISEDLIIDNSQSSVNDVISTDVAPAENECKTYDYSNDEELQRDSLTVTGNADAVLAIECIENGFIAACLDGNVYHFSSDGQLINTLRGSNLAVTCLTIVKEKYGTTVYTGSLDSRIRYYDLETGLEKGPECNVLSPIQTMDRAWDTVFVGTRTGFVLQFECKNNMLIPVSTVKFSEQAILALRAMKEGPRKVLLVASRSENVTVKDAQTGLLLRTLSGPKMTVYTLLFEDGKVYCGTSSHQIHVFDYATGIHTNSHEGGKGAVCLRATGGLLFAGCYDGCIYIYREGETRPLAQLRGPSLMLLSLAILEIGRAHV